MKKGKLMNLEKLLKIIHFLARNDLAVKELHPKITSFPANELHETIFGKVS